MDDIFLGLGGDGCARCCLQKVESVKTDEVHYSRLACRLLNLKHADKLEARAEELGIGPLAYRDNAAVFWDLFGEQGFPIRTTVSEMGPLLLARLLDLNDTQEGVLQIVFRHADEQGLLLLDLGDLQAMLAHTAENAKDLSARYGNVTKASVGAIQRQLLSFEAQGADQFFGEPALEIADFLSVDEQGRGTINVLSADKLMRSPKLYATFLFWLLAELFEALPEVGDPEKPVLVFFFDEAHLLFDDAPPALEDAIEQVVRLIRSKGVGVYFVTQNPIDIPEKIAGQLGNRVQHALRAFTPRDKRAIRAAAETFRINPDLDVESAITELKVGEALVSTLDADGAPTVVQRTLIAPPHSRLAPVTAICGNIDTAPWCAAYPVVAEPELGGTRIHNLALGQGRQGRGDCGGGLALLGRGGERAGQEIQRRPDPRRRDRLRAQHHRRLDALERTGFQTRPFTRRHDYPCERRWRMVSRIASRAALRSAAVTFPSPSASIRAKRCCKACLLYTSAVHSSCERPPLASVSSAAKRSVLRVSCRAARRSRRCSARASRAVWISARESSPSPFASSFANRSAWRAARSAWSRTPSPFASMRANIRAPRSCMAASVIVRWPLSTDRA